MAGSAVLPLAMSLHPPETIMRVEYANTCTPDPDVDPYLCDATLSDFVQTRVTDTLGPDSTIGGSGTGTLSDDPLIQFRDTSGDGAWIAAPGVTGGGATSSSECVFRDADSDGVVDAGEAIGGTCPGSGTVSDDPKIKYRDADGTGTRTGTEKVFYDFDSNDQDNTGTITFTTDIIIYNSVNVFAWQVKVSYDPSKFNVRLFNIGQIWTDSGGSGFPSINNVAGTAGFGATLTNVLNAVTNPGPISLVRVNWRVMNEGASNIHLVTDVEDVNFGIQLLDSSVPGRNILYDTEDGFVSTINALSALPNPEFTASPNPVDPGSIVAFDAAQSTNVDSFDWNFGDATTDSGSTVSHTYAAECDPSLRPRPINSNGCYRAVLRGSNLAGSASSSKMIIVQARPNAAPVATEDAYTMEEDTPLTVIAPGVLSNDNDPDGDPITAVLVTGPSSGTLNLGSDGGFTYTPAANFFGSVTFTYQARDIANAPSNTATVTITVNAVNDAPVANNDSYTTDVDAPLSVPSPGVLSNDSDADGDALTAVFGSGPSSGTLSLSPDGSFTYTPDAGFAGTDTFTYTATDGSLTSNTATVTLRVGANTPPTAVDDTYTTDEDRELDIPAAAGVLSNDTDPDGDPLTAIIITGPSSGNLLLNSDGSFAYASAPNFNGQDSFTYQASDGFSGSNTATVTITIQAVNDAPVANDDAYTTDEDAPLITSSATGVLANDIDPEGDPFSAVLVSPPARGTLVLNADGSFTYSPALNDNGQVSFTYRGSDGTGIPSVAIVTITIAEVNDPPVLPNLPNRIVTQGNQLTITITAADPDTSQTLVYSLEPGFPEGASITPDGVFSWTPTADQVRTHTITVRVFDGFASDTGSFTVTVSPPQQAPTVLRPFWEEYWYLIMAAVVVLALLGVLANRARGRKSQ